MFIVIPLRFLTAIIGLLLGYTAGTYLEILYEKQHDYRPEVVALLTAFSQTISDNEGEYTSGYDDDIAALCVDGTDTVSDTSDSCE